MKCPKCNRPLPYGSKYCLFCDMQVENDEIPAPAEPTRVMPPVGKKEKKSRLKPEKRRQLILFYSSIGAIALLILLFFFVLFRSCSDSGEKEPAFSFSVDSSASLASSVSSSVSLPVYNTVSQLTSAETSSQAISSAAASSQTVSQPTILPAVQYLSFTLADLKKNFGEISGKEQNEGGGSILSFAGCKYKFILDAETPADGDRVTAIIVTAGGEIVPGASVGQTYNQIFSAFNTSFQFAYDETEEIAVATTRYNNASIYIYFEQEDKNIPSLSALIKLD